MENYLYLGLFVVLIMLVFSPTRSLLMDVIKGPGVRLWTSVMSFTLMLIKAHLLIIKNFAPRKVVLPTLDKGSKK